ncbi:DUF4129 domain-containing protein [Saccharibacillus sp. CPCC 101409]|uniref:DUF4129 domain-containing protein n=1 Tax=Saccharibacillus sp. CPCC 101409 TaxID=3058041 RepID=UPI0026740D9E|nr:DUF4129 domain-containing protein [Saccharibacillus sp. CPCC 101409]MDO3408752.1 DUF4129 domain-containing protein [Saccharibacillus sp. CPCC 101409]
MSTVKETRKRAKTSQAETAAETSGGKSGKTGGKAALRGLGRPAAYSVLEALSAYAPIVLLSHYVLKLPDLLPLLIVFALHACTSLIGLRQAEHRLPRWLTVPPFAAALAAALLIPGAWFVRAAAALLLLAVAVRGLLVGRRQYWDNMQLRVPLIGLGASLVVYVVAGRTAELAGYRGTLYIAAVLLLVLTLLLLNADKVRFAAGEQTSALAGILTANRRLTWAVAALVVIAGIVGGPTGILGAIRDWWASIFSGSATGPPLPSDPLPSADYSQLGKLAGEAKEAPLWLKVVGYIFLILFYAAAAAGVLWLLYRIFGRWLPSGIRNLIRRIAAQLGLMRTLRASGDPSDYTDKAEKLSAKETGNRRRLFGFGRREPAYSGSDPRLRYRSVVLQAARKGFPLRASRTPFETGAELTRGDGYTELSAQELRELVERYNSTRYGGESGPRQ